MAVADWDAAELTKQSNRLRRDTGASITLLPDASAEPYFEESEELYPADTAKMLAYARVLVLRGIRASASMLGKYAQGQSEEDLEKVFDNLTIMLSEAIAEVDKVSDPIEETATPFFFGVAQGQRGR
jgi:hypothetical protein